MSFVVTVVTVSSTSSVAPVSGFSTRFVTTVSVVTISSATANSVTTLYVRPSSQVQLRLSPPEPRKVV